MQSTQSNSSGQRDPRRRSFGGRSPRERESDLKQVVLDIKRVSKVVKGGRNISFNAMVVVGDGKGRVGAALGHSQSVPEAVRKGINVASKNMTKIPLKGTTIPHEAKAKFKASKVLILPASSGTGVIAGGGVRAVMEAAGVKDVLTKRFGSNNPINVVKASIKALKTMNDIDAELALRKNVDTSNTSPAPPAPPKEEIFEEEKSGE